jgi:hypothetical protein
VRSEDRCVYISETGRTDRSPLAPATGNGASSGLYDVQGVVTQKTLARTAAGASQYGFFRQSRFGADDGDPTSSDGIFVFMGSFTTLIGGYEPKVGDEVVLRAGVGVLQPDATVERLAGRRRSDRARRRHGRRRDRRREPDERFLLAVGGDPRFRYTRAVATGTIVNDD